MVTAAVVGLAAAAAEHVRRRRIAYVQNSMSKIIWPCASDHYHFLPGKNIIFLITTATTTEATSPEY